MVPNKSGLVPRKNALVPKKIGFILGTMTIFVGTKRDTLGTKPFDQSTKRIPLRWPKTLFDGVKVIADKQRTSMQTIITEALLEKFHKYTWRVGTQKEIENLIEWAESQPIPTIKEAVIKAKDKLNIDIFEKVDDEGDSCLNLN